MAESPMIAQYKQIKEEYNDCILMFRLGDFYEMFYEDASVASKELELALTARDSGNNERAPMCGVPYHAVEAYISKLVANGHKVAICEQIEDPKLTKTLVKRDVIRVITPGTVTEGDLLKDKSNNYICAAFIARGGVGLAFADISTGEINATCFEGTDYDDYIISQSSPFSPSELFISEKPSNAIISFFHDKLGAYVSVAKGDEFGKETAEEAYKNAFGAVADVDFNVSLAKRAVGALLIYLKSTQKRDMDYFKPVQFYTTDEFLQIDSTARKSLEITENIRTGDRKGSLLWAIDNTKTAMGARLLRKTAERPSVNCGIINKRLDAVEELLKKPVVHGELSDLLNGFCDVERLLTRLVFGTANARDMKALEEAFSLLPPIKKLLEGFECSLLSRIYQSLDVLEDIHSLISCIIIDKPPFSVREGGMIKDGASELVDELRMIMKDGSGWISRIEATEREKTGIKTLKIGYNKVFGYYIEISNSFLKDVPETYIRRQTLVNGERFITPELKDMESRVITAKERDQAFEFELFTKLKDSIVASSARIQNTARYIAQLDVFCSFAECARLGNYTRPEVDEGQILDIKNGRHPVVEKVLKDTFFVPNDCMLDGKSNTLSLITGPNMAGKSTYMRQNALIIILAQMGSFVPASQARIGVCDKIFTRVGASDDLSSGNSTFMVEMTEVASILKNATRRSFIIYDEIGRGTSTYDGMSIARAVAEYTVKRLGAKTLFATHYHELADLEELLDGVVNYNITAKKRGDSITFLRKIVKGPAASSYGIEVAALAGLPTEVLSSAKNHLKEAEKGERKVLVPAEDDNITFSDISSTVIAEKLKALDINTITPIEALGLLYELKKAAE